MLLIHHGLLEGKTRSEMLELHQYEMGLDGMGLLPYVSYVYMTGIGRLRRTAVSYLVILFINPQFLRHIHAAASCIYWVFSLYTSISRDFDFFPWRHLVKSDRGLILVT